ncbi:MAG TPA: T9SS type A sorting domain-containing protein [Flavobacteriales bacterium]|nr:T9SS type A sorting domain-containing protein [Flavobacteriales bacterium]
MRRVLFLLPVLLHFSLSHAVTVEISIEQSPVCSHAVGILSAFASGGVSPYAYQWSTGSTSSTISGLTAGTYSVTVTDANAEVATADLTLEALTEWTMIGMGSHNYCPGQGPYGHISAGYFLAGGDQFSTDLSAAFPLSIDATTTDFFNPNMSPAWLGNGYIIHGSYSGEPITFTDATGCPGTISGHAAGPVVWPTVTSVEVAPSCGPNPNGNIVVFRTGGSNSSLHGPNNTSHWDTGVDQQEPFYNVPAGGHWLVQTTRTPGPNSLNWDYLPAAQCGDSIYVVVPDAGPACGELSGTVYIDLNEDCVHDVDEIGAAYQVLTIEPGPRYTSTDFSGNYTANVPLGTYTITAWNDALEAVCPAQATVSSLIASVELDLPVIGTAGPAPDLWATLVSGPARPGFELIYTMRARNLNYGPSGVVTATFTADAITPIISVDPLPDITSGQTLTWILPNVLPFAQPWFQVRVQVPPDVGLIGTYLSAGWQLTSANLDLNPVNNSTTLNTLVTGSYDPNDKLAVTSTGASEQMYFIDQDDWIDYTIRFQNTGTDTAFTVVISDTLEAVLDPASLRVGASSHPFTWDLGYGNVLRFRFDDILLPDSNVNEVASHGQVMFRIKPLQPLVPGTLIENTANIYFDFNPPVITEPSVLVAEFSTGVQERSLDGIRLMPNPVNNELRINANGSIASLRIIAADGREVLARAVRAANSSIAVDRLQTGAYLLIATFADGSEVRERFIKQ